MGTAFIENPNADLPSTGELEAIDQRIRLYGIPKIQNGVANINVENQSATASPTKQSIANVEIEIENAVAPCSEIESVAVIKNVTLLIRKK